MSQDLFDLMSGPSPAPQSFQPGQFNMSAPPAAQMSTNLSPMGFQAAPNAAMPQSPFSQPGSSGQMMGAFPASSNPPSTGTDQFAGLFSMQPTPSTQPVMSGALGQSSQQTGQPNMSVFGGQPGQQNTSIFGQTGQQNNSSPFGQMGQPSMSVFDGQPGQQTASVFGQTGQQNTSSPFGQAGQQNTSLFGQPGQQNTPSPFGQTSQQSNSVFGQTGQQNNSVFGQTGQQNNASAFGLAGQPTTSPFGQTSQPNTTTPFAQLGQLTSPGFGQPGQQTTGMFGQQQTGQATQPPLGLFGQPAPQQGTAFGTSSSPIPKSQTNSNSLHLDGFLAMPKTPNNTPTNAMMQSTATGSLFGGLATTSSGSSPGMAFQNPFGVAAPVPDNKISNAAAAFGSSGASDDLFAALSSPSSNTKQPVSSMSPSSSGLNDDFFDAFSSSTSLANKPTPAPASDLNFDMFSSPPSAASTNTNTTSNTAPSSDSSFDPFGNFATPPQASGKSQQQAAAEPLFDDAFSATPVAPPAVREPAPSTANENKAPTPVIPEPATPSETPAPSVIGVKAEEPKETTNSEISDPVLREVNEKFGGRWKLLRSDPYDEFLKSVGVGLVHRKRAGTGSPEQLFEVKDGQIHITMKSSIHSQFYVFKLNEETENMVEKTPQSVFCSYSNGKLFLQMTPVGDAFGKTQEVERFINENNEHVLIHSAGIASCRRYFGKMDPLPTKGTILNTPKPAESTPTVHESTKTNEPTESVAPSKPVASQSPEVQMSSLAPDEPAPPRAASPQMILELQPPPASPMTPGQMLLQNLNEMSDDPEGDGIVDNGNILVFAKNPTEESDA